MKKEAFPGQFHEKAFLSVNSKEKNKDGTVKKKKHEGGITKEMKKMKKEQ